MLSSIHPLGERSRHNRWVVTVGAFTVASVIAGAAVGALLGALGMIVTADVGEGSLFAMVAVIAVLAGILDWRGVEPPGPRRQVNETWIGFYRGSVYGAAFGSQLGLGVMTYVVTWGVYATFAAEFLSGSWWIGTIIGATFGMGRSIAPLLAGWIDRPSRLTAFHSRLSRLGPVVRVSGAWVTTALGAMGLVFVVI